MAETAVIEEKEFESFEEFYPFYLQEHSHPTSRALHYAGTIAAVLNTVYAVAAGKPARLLLSPILGYGPAWIGHFFFEKNKPATFKYPLYSFRGDFHMLKDWITGNLPFDKVEDREVSAG